LLRPPLRCGSRAFLSSCRTWLKSSSPNRPECARMTVGGIEFCAQSGLEAVGPGEAGPEWSVCPVQLEGAELQHHLVCSFTPIYACAVRNVQARISHQNFETNAILNRNMLPRFLTAITSSNENVRMSATSSCSVANRASGMAQMRKRYRRRVRRRRGQRAWRRS
jgi:hypothetical protein